MIEVRVREMSQIFNSLDPSPFHEQELSREAEEYIVGSAKELPDKSPSALVVHVDRPSATGDEERVLETAVHAHFARGAHAHLRRRRELIREGLIGLAIGLTILLLFFIIGQAIVHARGETGWATLVREGLYIGGWVAMWRPLEILLYLWWPIEEERRLHDRLSRIPVRVLPSRE